MARFIVFSCLLLYNTGFVFAQNGSTKSRVDFGIDTSRSPIFCFDYKPQPNTSYRWGFYHKADISKGKLPFVRNDKVESKDTQFCVDYRDSMGVYWVCLVATNGNGIQDTICKRIAHRIESTFYYPMVFFPDNKDSKYKTTFHISLDRLNIFSMSLVIYDRWGLKVFETTDKNMHWNGNINNDGKPCNDGTYYYILKYQLMGEDKNEPVVNGTVQLFR
ncbi:MAG: gliding motility-associated C-terminal domain-containing protein [bacterium]|nr:gliding motility-associated C-terminal domain-containing protein [bacterium]